MPRIVLTDVTKRYGSFYAVDHLDLVIEDKSFVTLLGPSGCGKTTTLRMIAGLETPTSGRIEIGNEVVFDGEKGIDVPANRRRVGFLFQNYALWPNMTVYDNIAYVLKGRLKNGGGKRDRAGIDAVVRRMAAMVKIEPFLDRYPSELSGGQQQRVAIARTLAPEPEVVFMDEPLSSLDAKLRLDMRSELQRLHLATGRTFVYVTHDQMEAMTLATDICLLRNGVLQQYAPPLEVYRRPANLFAADFVGAPSINFIDAAGSQTADGSLALTLWGGVPAAFRFEEPVDLARWRAEEAERTARKEALQAERAERRGFVKKSNEDAPFPYPVPLADPGQKPPAPGDDGLVLAVRPETVEIGGEGGVEAEVYSAMPTGMETTVLLRVGNFLLTAVVFGGVTFPIGKTVRLSFRQGGAAIFSRRSGELIGAGGVEV